MHSPSRWVKAGHMKSFVSRPYAEFCGLMADRMRPAHKAVEVGREDAWLELPLDKPKAWTVAYRLGVQRGALAISEIRIFPTGGGRQLRQPGQWSAEVLGASAPFPPGGITTGLLRKVRVGAHYRYAWKVIRQLGAEETEFFGGAATESRTSMLDDLRGRPGPGRRRIPDAYLARIAAAYERQGSSHPYSALKDQFGLEQERLRDLVRKARDRRILAGEPTPGKRYGGLTSYGRELLRVRQWRFAASKARRRKEVPRVWR